MLVLLCSICFPSCAQFITEGLTLLLALRIAGMDSLDAIPAGYEGSLEDKKRWLDRLALQVVDKCWKAPCGNDIRTVMDSLQEDTDFKGP